MKVKYSICEKCNKRRKFDVKFRLRNFPFIFALACSKCNTMYYY